MPGDGCDKSLAWWFTEEPWRPNKDPDAPKARDLMTMSALPKACRAVLDAPSPVSEAAATYPGGAAVAAAPRDPARRPQGLPGTACAFLPTSGTIRPIAPAPRA